MITVAPTIKRINSSVMILVFQYYEYTIYSHSVHAVVAFVVEMSWELKFSLTLLLLSRVPPFQGEFCMQTMSRPRHWPGCYSEGIFPNLPHRWKQNNNIRCSNGSTAATHVTRPGSESHQSVQHALPRSRLGIDITHSTV